MTENPILALIIVSLIPVIMAVFLYILDTYTPFGKIPYMVRQVFFGIIFGSIAVLGTEWGIPMNGAQVNCRDAAVLIGGLMFGGPAGIIAGLIGGIERWFAVYWGIGTFTQVACSVSTALAGLYSATLRKFMFENKKPGWMLSLAVGVVMEVFHLTMVFITNLDNVDKAMAVVKSCTAPMVIANGLAVMLASIALSLVSKEKKLIKRSNTRISQTIQRWLFVTVFLAFAATSAFVLEMQNRLAEESINSTLKMAVEEVSADLKDASDKNMIMKANLVAKEINDTPLQVIADKYSLSEISVVNSKGIIFNTTNKGYFGYDMASGSQSSAFMRLLWGSKEYVQEYGPISYDDSIYMKYAGVAIEDGFIQIGYNAEGFQKDIDSEIENIAKNRHVGETGFIVILNGNSEVVAGPSGIKKTMIKDQVGDIKNIPEGQRFTIDYYDETCYCTSKPTEGYYIISVFPETEAYRMKNISIYVNSYMEILVFALLFGLVYVLIQKVVVNQIKKVNSSLDKITEGNLDEVVNVRSNEEFASLSDDINSTVDKLKEYIAEAAARIDKELEFAKSIQASALPSTFPAFPQRKDFDIFASMNPAKEVGGDFYDFYLTNNDTLNFLVADVSGKGIPAAMFMMRAKTELKSLTEAGMKLDEVFTKGNAALCEGNDAGMFVTAWQGSLNLTTGLLQYANAGHNPPLIRHADGGFEYLRSRAGFVLAGMDGVRYKIQEYQLDPGDTVFLYTDGVTEATDAHTELYGEDRLINAINSREFDNVQQMCKFLKADVDGFVGEAPQFDDITMVSVKYIGTPAAPSIHIDEAQIADITRVTAFVEEQLEAADAPMKAIMQVNVAIDEIFSNIVNYGYKQGPGPIDLQIVIKEDPKRMSLKFEDEGIPYNPLVKEDPDVTLSVDERGVGGLGIYMVKNMMDNMSYRYENDKNILILEKNLE
ncbi:MAG: SpoIIE family protein phosphatase [Lachnospiraceae bacterium]|nr:SpoIIE family protein phosphatase [Candidatus Minthocola equi]